MSPLLQHPARARLVAFVDGKLSETELSDIEQHVEQCDDCATTVEALIEDGTFLKNVQHAHRGGTAHSASLSDRDLLFGRLAVHTGFIDQETLDKAQQQVADPTNSLSEVLVVSGAITKEDRQAIENLLERHIAKHDDDPQQSLSSLVHSPTVSFAAPSGQRLGMIQFYQLYVL